MCFHSFFCSILLILLCLFLLLLYYETQPGSCAFCIFIILYIYFFSFSFIPHVQLCIFYPFPLSPDFFLKYSSSVSILVDFTEPPENICLHSRCGFCSFTLFSQQALQLKIISLIFLWHLALLLLPFAFPSSTTNSHWSTASSIFLHSALQMMSSSSSVLHVNTRSNIGNRHRLCL